MVDLANESPVDPKDAQVQKWLCKMQGNILKGHGRNHGAYLFFSFGEDQAAVRRTIAALAQQYVTSALAQHLQAERFRLNRTSGELFGNLFITARGYERLGFDPGSLFPEDEDKDDPETASTFAGGMRATAVDDLGDPPVGEWEEGFRDSLDAMLLLAHDDEKALALSWLQAGCLIRSTCVVHTIEVGRVLRNSEGAGVEHFGFADGRSQPVYLTTDFEFNKRQNPERVTESNGEGIDQWDPFEPLGRVLRIDPAANDPLALGSYLVFRKLEQDVQGFRKHVDELAGVLGLTGRDAARAGAMVVGRFQDGTPVVLQKEDGWFPREANNFTYDTDVRGARCPLHAHIRKVNARGHTGDATERSRRITRRSIPYGSPAGDAKVDGAPSGVGVLFMCFQASVRRQFAFIQKHWCNSPDFPQGDAGIDPLVGQNPNRSFGWPVKYNDRTDTPAPLESFIRMKGGEFFFAPSLPFFAGL